MIPYLLPNDEEFVNQIARAIARDRLLRDATEALQEMTGLTIRETDALTSSFDRAFELLWAGNSDIDRRQKASYAADAIAAINAINLKLLTS